MPLLADDIAYLLALARDRAALAIEPGQEYLLSCRLAGVANQHKLPSVEALVAKLRMGRAEALAQDTIDALTTNETSFFRDIHPYDALATQILPDLMTRRRAARQLTIWCAACSSGQEPYSIAMTIRERVPELLTWRLRIIATDVSQAMVDRTRAGAYSQAEINRGLPARMLTKYLTQQGTEWQMRPELRGMLEVQRTNLVDAQPMTGCDLVLLRNVLIYFDAAGKRRVLDRVTRALAPDGLLLVGVSETLFDDRYDFRVVGRTYVYSPRSPAAAPARRGASQEKP